MWFVEGMDPSPMRRNPKRRFRPTRYKDIDTVMENQRDLVEVAAYLEAGGVREGLIGTFSYAGACRIM